MAPLKLTPINLFMNFDVAFVYIAVDHLNFLFMTSSFKQEIKIAVQSRPHVSLSTIAMLLYAPVYGQLGSKVV